MPSKGTVTASGCVEWERQFSSQGIVVLELSSDEGSVLEYCAAQYEVFFSKAPSSIKESTPGYQALGSKELMLVTASNASGAPHATVFQWMARTGRQQLECVAKGHELAVTRMMATLDELPLGLTSAPLMHVSHYAPGGQCGMGCLPHVDSALLTLVYSSEADGLQVQTPGGSWLDVPLGPRKLAVLPGYALQYATAGIIRATPHCVKAPPPGTTRTSLAFKLRPRLDAFISPAQITHPHSLPANTPATLTGRQLQHMFEMAHPESVNSRRPQRAEKDQQPSIASIPIQRRPSGSAPEESFSISIRNLSGRSRQLQGITSSTTVLEVKELYQEKEGIPPDQARLIYKGTQLDNTHTLGSCNIEPDAVLLVVLPLRD